MKLPQILAGPIVRRATPERIYIWLATTENVRFEAPVLELHDTGAGYASIPVSSSATSLRLGEHLVVHLLTAAPERDELPVEVPIAYDIVDAAGRRLRDLTELGALTLRRFKLPTFVLGDPAAPRLHALYGSCRQLHGPNPDMMRGALRALEEAPDGRPSYLFLGGDQIYADDVDRHLLLSVVMPIGVQILGRAERIPNSPLYASEIEDRGVYLERAATGIFTSGAKASHLLSFGDFLAMYLFAWNDEMWAEAISAAPVVLLHASARLREGMVGARQTRKVLANMITYMIFDDHEITDDWFRTQEWRERALGNDLARWVITNGLAAYWAFQGWGNDPESFSDDFAQLMGDHARRGAREPEARAALLAAGRWSFMAPTSPPSLFLDTRTGRMASPPGIVDEVPAAGEVPTVGTAGTFSSPCPGCRHRRSRNPEAPRLLGTHERARLAQLLDQHAVTGQPLLVISPAPIFGFRPVEEFQEMVGTLDPDVADLESWAGNPRNMVDFLALVYPHDPRPLIVLSGDVHYAFELLVSVSSASRTMPVAQLCSSALKNAPGGRGRWGAWALQSRRILKTPVGWWTSTTADDGPVLRGHYHARRERRRRPQPLESAPSFVTKEEVVTHGNGRILLRNNVGELIVDGPVLRHRFWSPRGTRDELVDWRATDWPVPRVWSEDE